jgi:hypothetical protein
MTTKIDSNTKLSFDVREAKKFLDALCGADCRKESFAWQTFADDKTRKSNNLVDTWSSPFSKETAAKLERLNGQGAGIFVTSTNATAEGARRKT